MSTKIKSIALSPGSDCTDLFRAAYENRYTWEPGFSGYEGKCICEDANKIFEGTFKLDDNFNALVDGIGNDLIHKAISAQLWEVSIHRVRRSFDETHGQNTFTAWDTNSQGTEVIVGGKNVGDRYRINNQIVTMVRRYIQGTLVIIFTESTTNTSKGYLAHKYNSQYLDPTTGFPCSGINHFTDTFFSLADCGAWILTKRVIQTESHDDTTAKQQVFSFVDLKRV